mmetsp:Transcript_41714/g.67672  ORF Transcript_41714/g.67672 Transcript_41714/m.67672 type:complete len:224 (+) Transcript_41714:3242-3913(+)
MSIRASSSGLLSWTRYLLFATATTLLHFACTAAFGLCRRGAPISALSSSVLLDFLSFTLNLLCFFHTLLLLVPSFQNFGTSIKIFLWLPRVILWSPSFPSNLVLRIIRSHISLIHNLLYNPLRPLLPYFLVIALRLSCTSSTFLPLFISGEWNGRVALRFTLLRRRLFRRRCDLLPIFYCFSGCGIVVRVRSSSTVCQRILNLRIAHRSWLRRREATLLRPSQ